MRAFLATALLLIVFVGSLMAGDVDLSAPLNRKALTREEAAKLKNPIPFTRASVSRGKHIYLRNCQYCHGIDGKATNSIDFESTDLTDIRMWRFGTTDGDIYLTTRDGAGDDMPPFHEQIKTEGEMWHLVNFVHRLRPKHRPFVKVEEKTEKKETESDKD